MEYVGLRCCNGEKEIALKSVSIDGVVTGLFTEITLTQIYKNSSDSSLEVIYVFPGSDTAAITDFQAEMGSKTIKGSIMEKEKAFRDYDDAIQAGDSGFLLEQTRPNVFQVSVGQILPDEEVKIKITYVDQLRYEDFNLRLTIPTVVAPRYIPGKTNGQRQGLGIVDPTDQVPDADLITPPVDNVDYTARMNITVYSPRVINVSSPSHRLNIKRLDKSSTVLSFQGETSEMDRDIVLCFEYDQDAEAGGMICFRDNTEAMAYLTFIPEIRTENRSNPKNYLFLVDISGSMRGDKLEETKKALKQCLTHLSSEDTFNLVGFESRLHCFSEDGNVPFNPVTLDRAIKWIDQLRAMGQTDMDSAIRFALKDSFHQTVFLLTDGQIGNEQEIFNFVAKHLNGSKIFTIGIDSAVNSYFLNRLAEMGKGKSEFIYPGENFTEKVVRQFARIASPSISNVKINWEGTEVKEYYPHRLEFLYDMEPVSIFALITGPVEGKIVLQGEIDGENLEWEIDSKDLIKINDTELLFKIWAKKKIEYLEQLRDTGNPRRASRIRNDIISLSEKYGVISSLTASVAIYERVEKNSGLSMVTTIVPVSIPKGWDQPEKMPLLESSVCLSYGPSRERLIEKPFEDVDIDKVLLDLDNYRNKEKMDKIREFPDYYEFCIIEGYEDKYENFIAHGIPLGPINLQLFELKNRIVLVSLEFSKEQFDLDDVLMWLNNYEVLLGEKGKGKNSISNSNVIIEGLRFKGYPLVLYEVGNRRISYHPDKFPEITELYSIQPQTIDTTKSKKVSTELSIFYNDEQVKVIPRIDFSKEDLIICNGQCILADYLDEYDNTIGFYRNNSPIPVAYVADKATTINIHLEDDELWWWDEKEYSRRCIVEYQYLLDEKSLDELQASNSNEKDPKSYVNYCIAKFREFLEEKEIDFEQEADQNSMFVLHLKYTRERHVIHYPEFVDLRILFEPTEQVVELSIPNYVSIKGCTKKSKFMQLINSLNMQYRFGVFYLDANLTVHIKEVIDIQDGFNPKRIVDIAQIILNAAEESYAVFRRFIHSFS